jgi:hypothetical protein
MNLFALDKLHIKMEYIPKNYEEDFNPYSMKCIDNIYKKFKPRTPKTVSLTRRQ